MAEPGQPNSDCVGWFVSFPAARADCAPGSDMFRFVTLYQNWG